MTLTNFEIQKEWDHVFQTRLGSLCDGSEPTLEQVMIAKKEANKWRMDYHKELADGRGV